MASKTLLLDDGRRVITGGRVGSGTASWNVSTPGVATMIAALKVLADQDLGAFRGALKKAGDTTADAIRTQGGSIASSTDFTGPRAGIKGSKKKLKAVVVIRHPGARSTEFGRSFYWEGYTGRDHKTGIKTSHRPGQRAEPFVGIKDGDHAMGQVTPAIEKLFADAVADVFNQGLL